MIVKLSEFIAEYNLLIFHGHEQNAVSLQFADAYLFSRWSKQLSGYIHAIYESPDKQQPGKRFYSPFFYLSSP